MTDIARGATARAVSPRPADASSARRLSVVAVGLSLSAFFALSYLICFAVEVLLPDPSVQAWLSLFPGTLAVNWLGLAHGLALSLIWGWYIAFAFVPIYNFFAARFR